MSRNSLSHAPLQEVTQTIAIKKIQRKLVHFIFNFASEQELIEIAKKLNFPKKLLLTLGGKMKKREKP